MKIDAYKAAHFNRGDAYSFQGKFDQAIRDYGDAIQLQPKSAAVYLSRAYAYVYTARYSLAVRDYEFAIDLLPLDDVAYNDLAWLLATAPSPAVRDGARAVTLAQRAVQLNNTASNVDTLASAYARDGQFEDAALAQESAIALLLAEGGALYLLDGYQVRLRMFHARQPYDESMQ